MTADDFAALERATPIVQAIDGIATTTSMRIANGTDVQHKNVLELIGNNLADFEEFGAVAFETRPHPTQAGAMQRIAILTEEHATLLLTYMRNSDVVRDFKKRLVREFYALRAKTREAEVVQHQIPQTYAAALRAAAEQSERAEMAEAKVAELEPKAEVADRLLDADGDLSVRDAAQALTRAGIKVGATRLFAELERRRWIKRGGGDGRWRVLQSAIEIGYMSVLPQSHYHPKTGVLVLDPPQPRVTPKGIQRLLADYDKS